ncbi:PTS lactose transporter subunit IIB, partial [Staphylococcus pasteuri]
SILITILEEPIQLQRNQNDLNSVHYLISMFIPDNQKMAQFVSVLSEALSEHLNDIEEFMQNPYEFKTILRNKLLNQIKNQLQ